MRLQTSELQRLGEVCSVLQQVIVLIVIYPGVSAGQSGGPESYLVSTTAAGGAKHRAGTQRRRGVSPKNLLNLKKYIYSCSKIMDITDVLTHI